MCTRVARVGAATRMADTILGAWWDRTRGRLQPCPCPYSLASALEMPGRKLVAAPVHVTNAFGIKGGKRVVEIGVGTGFYSVEAARRVGRAGWLIGIDLQMEMLLHRRRRLEANGQGRSSCSPTPGHCPCHQVASIVYS